MAKQGILHDYDLQANAEPAARKGTKCAVCEGDNIAFQWSDYHGEGMCTTCGCCYQLKAGSDEQVKENAYPYLNMLENFVPIAKEYWNETKSWVYYGTGFGPHPGLKELTEWVKIRHPEALTKKD